MIEKLHKLLIKHEGLRLKPYLDTEGKMTIGVGRNLTDVGISEEEAYSLLDHDIENASISIKSIFNDFDRFSEARQIALLDMMFNLGIDHFLSFKNTIALMQQGDWGAAADNMLQSRWAKQVGNRAVELAEMIRKG